MENPKISAFIACGKEKRFHPMKKFGFPTSLAAQVDDLHYKEPLNYERFERFERFAPYVYILFRSLEILPPRFFLSSET